MVFKIARSELFIPKSGENDKNELPVKFQLTYLTVADRSELDTFIVPVGNTDKSVKVKFDMKEAFLRSVKKIENLTVDDNGDMKEIINASDFVNLPFNQNQVLREWYDEVCLRIRETSEIQKKS